MSLDFPCTPVIPCRPLQFVARAGLALLFAAVARAQVVTETFKDATASGWVFAGVNYTPNLTSGGVDPAGDGWLRLTSTGTNQSTSAYYDTSFAATNATIYASFEYQSWGGTGADGITFFLFDGSKSFAVGADGGSLGYAQKTGVSGLNGGYLGVAIDEFGNFSNPTEGRVGGPGFLPDSFAVRGPGSGTTGYDYLGGTGSLSTSIDTPIVGIRPTTFNQVQILISPTNQLTVSLQQGASSPQTVLALDLSGYARPDTLKFGFSSGTGASTNNHEVRNLNVTTLVANLWDGAQGDGLWATSNNWDPNILPAAGADLLFNNTFATTAQTINTGANRTVRSLSFDAPFTYTLNNNTITFDAGSVPGFTGIAATQTRGSAPHTINSNLALANDITIRNNSAGTLSLNGNTSTAGNDIAFDGSGTTAVSGVISGGGAISKSESGTVQLNATNTYTGGTTLSGGTISTNNNSGLGTGAITLAGGTLTSTAGNTLANTTTLTGNAAVSNITLSGAFTQSGGNRTLTLNNATLSGPVSLSNNSTNRTLTVATDTGASSTLSGVISNGSSTASSLTKTGAGTLTLSGANTYTGTTTISAGTLALGASDRLANTSAMNIAGGTLDLSGNSEQVGNMQFSNNGTLDFGTLGTANSFLASNITSASGVLTVANWESGSDIFATSTALGSGTLNSIYFVGYGAGATQLAAQSVSGYGSGWRPIEPTTTGWFTWDSGNATNRWDRGANWDSNTVPTSGAKVAFGTGAQTTVDLRGNRTVEAIRFDEGSAAFTITAISTTTNTLTFDGPASLAFIQQKSANNQTISPGGGVILTDNTVVDMIGAGNLTISSALSGSGNLVKENTGGSLILSGNSSSYAGNIFVNAGTLQANSANALGNTTGTTTIAAGGTLALSGTFTSAETISVAGAGDDGGGALRAISGTSTLSGAITLTGATTFHAESGDTLTLSNTATGVTGTQALTLDGAGNINLARLANGAGGVTINSTGTTTFNGTTTANTNTGTTTVNAGNLVLSKTAGTNAIAGNLVIGDGSGTDTVTLAASNQIANTSIVTVNSSGVFNLNNQSETIAELDGVAGASVQLGSGTLGISGSGESVYAGSLSGTGTLAKTGTGKLSLTGSSAGYSGSVNLSSGIINASGSAASMLGTGTVTVSGTGNLELQGGATLANPMILSSLGTGALDGALQNIAGNNSVTGAVTLTANSRVQSDSGQLSFTNNVALNANDLNVGGSGNTAISGVISGTGSLTKDGAGLLTLSGANTFTGATTINDGTIALAANNVFANSNAISLGTLGTLNLAGFDDTIGSISGTGSIDFGSAGTSALSLSSGVSVFSGQFLGSGELIIGPGATLTLGADFANTNLKITLAGGTLNLNGHNASFGDLSITGNSIVDFGAGTDSVLSINGVSFANTGLQLSVNNWTDAADFFYSNTNPGPKGSAPTNQIVFNGFSGNDTRWDSFDHQITPVPEPSTYGAALMALLGGFLYWRRRSRRS